MYFPCPSPGRLIKQDPLVAADAGGCVTAVAGSPVVNAVKQRLAGMEVEYKELDTVWFMAGEPIVGDELGLGLGLGLGVVHGR